MSAADADKARSIGVSGAIVSNHGGRQLDGTFAPVQMIQEIRQAVGGELQLIVDGGITRGTDIVKALSLGADACAIGKAYLYGLGAGGQAGVEKCLQILTDEVRRCMTLLGCNSISELSERHIRSIGNFEQARCGRINCSVSRLTS